MTKHQLPIKLYSEKETMMKRNRLKLTLNQAETYQIKDPGVLDILGIDIASSMNITVEESNKM